MLLFIVSCWSADSPATMIQVGYLFRRRVGVESLQIASPSSAELPVSCDLMSMSGYPEGRISLLKSYEACSIHWDYFIHDIVAVTMFLVENGH